MVSTQVVVAYEPVWAIGTGKVATPDQAQAAHVAVRRALATLVGEDAARAVRVQYGGSVTPDSVDALLAMPDVDGALVGGASLSAEAFSRIVEFAPPATVGVRGFPIFFLDFGGRERSRSFRGRFGSFRGPAVISARDLEIPGTHKWLAST